MKLLIILSVLVLATLVLAKPDYQKKFKEFQSKFKKNYRGCKKSMDKAMANLQKKWDKIEEHNAKFARGEEDWEMGEYDFDDEDPEIVIKSKCGTRPPASARALPQSSAVPYFPPGPATADFKNLMQPVVNQGNCGSCWSFASIAVAEAQVKKKFNGVNMQLSPQELVDCSRTGNYGCDGGWPKNALDYIKARGVATAAACPYREIQSACRTYSRILNVFNETYDYGLLGNEVTAKNIIAASGPVAVAMYVGTSFTNYKSGIYYDATCPTSCSQVNHGVVIVGYGTDYTLSTPRDFWLVRNSWGANWGEGGYIRMARNRGNNCLITCNLMFGK